MKALKIEAGKFYRTRDGRKAGIYRTDVNHSKDTIHGYVVELNGAERPNAWTSNGGFYNTVESKLDLISEWQEPLDFDWDCLPKWADKYIAMDEDREWCGYSGEPIIATKCPEGVFHGSNVNYISIPSNFAPKNFTGDWEDSLFKNPNLD